MLALLEICNRNPLRTDPQPRFQVFREGRDSSTGSYWREPTEWVFDTYAEADNKADLLGVTFDFWHTADDAEEGES